jgi:hypothetical protein
MAVRTEVRDLRVVMIRGGGADANDLRECGIQRWCYGCNVVRSFGWRLKGMALSAIDDLAIRILNKDKEHHKIVVC